MLVAAAMLVSIVTLHGSVTIGPTQPVCAAGSPCTKPAAHAILQFTQKNRLRWATTDAKGRYTVRLEPGTWVVRTNYGVRVTPQRFVVRSVPTQLRNFAIDTGIR
jgi:hypothetical protein